MYVYIYIFFIDRREGERERLGERGNHVICEITFATRESYTCISDTRSKRNLIGDAMKDVSKET
jgi:hypothetical protein